MSGEAVKEEERGCSTVEEEERGYSTVGCSLYSRERLSNKGGAGVEPWAANGGSCCGWDVVGAVWVLTSGK
jgi:hypothetical protein